MYVLFLIDSLFRYLSRMLAHLLHADLRFASRPGVGTVFWLSVPLEQPFREWGELGQSGPLVA